MILTLPLFLSSLVHFCLMNISLSLKSTSSVKISTVKTFPSESSIGPTASSTAGRIHFFPLSVHRLNAIESLFWSILGCASLLDSTFHHWPARVNYVVVHSRNEQQFGQIWKEEYLICINSIPYFLHRMFRNNRVWT